MMKKTRGKFQKIKDFLFFPLRALALPEEDKWGLSAWSSERFYYVAEEARGYCLDVGCGLGNRFVKEFLSGNGKGIDVYAYEGLSSENVISDIGNFPFPPESFDTVTFIANINHIPENLRLLELQEAYRCLRSGGGVIVTMGNRFLETAAHKVLEAHDHLLKEENVYHNHGTEEEEIYHLSDKEILVLLAKAGFKDLRKKYFLTQWGLNHLFIGNKI